MAATVKSGLPRSQAVVHSSESVTGVTHLLSLHSVAAPFSLQSSLVVHVFSTHSPRLAASAVSSHVGLLASFSLHSASFLQALHVFAEASQIGVAATEHAELVRQATHFPLLVASVAVTQNGLVASLSLHLVSSVQALHSVSQIGVASEHSELAVHRGVILIPF